MTELWTGGFVYVLLSPSHPDCKIYHKHISDWVQVWHKEIDSDILLKPPLQSEIAYSSQFGAGDLRAYFPQMTSPIVLTPKRTILAWKHVVWAIKRKNRFSGLTWAQHLEKIRAGQDRTGQSKKSQSGNISPIWGEVPLYRLKPKFAWRVISLSSSRAQNFNMKFSGVTLLEGVEFPIIILIIAWALQQCSTTALPIINHLLSQR